MQSGRLPVAPRPHRDELLSSWMARVACRYGLTAPELSGYLCGLPSPLPIDDRVSAAGQTKVWAQFCGVDPDRLYRLSLNWLYPRRTRAWYMNTGPEWIPSTLTGSTPVCLRCFAADQSAGRDGYLRSGWVLAERCICSVHGELLLDRCQSCHRHLFVAFRLLEGRAQPVCSSCGSILAGGGGVGDRSADRNLMRNAFAIQQRVTASVDRGYPEQQKFEKALAILWAPLDHPAAARPVLALWLKEAGWRCPYDVRHAVGAAAPLGQLPVRWRLVTLLALNDCFGTDLAGDGEMPPLAVQLVRRAAPRQCRLPRPGRRPHVQVLKRSPAEYERLANHIMADPRWIAAEKLSRRKRERVRALLIDAALAGNLAAAHGPMLLPQSSNGEEIQI